MGHSNESGQADGEEHGGKSGKRWSGGREPGNSKGGRNRAGSDLESLDSTLALACAC